MLDDDSSGMWNLSGSLGMIDAIFDDARVNNDCEGRADILVHSR